MSAVVGIEGNVWELPMKLGFTSDVTSSKESGGVWRSPMIVSWRAENGDRFWKLNKSAVQIKWVCSRSSTRSGVFLWSDFEGHLGQGVGFPAKRIPDDPLPFTGHPTSTCLAKQVNPSAIISKPDSDNGTYVVYQIKF